MMMKPIRYLFNIAGGAGVAFGVSNLMESRPHLGTVSIVLGAAFIAASEAIKYHQNAKAEREFAKFIPIPTGPREFFIGTGETREEFTDRFVREVLADLDKEPSQPEGRNSEVGHACVSPSQPCVSQMKSLPFYPSEQRPDA